MYFWRIRISFEIPGGFPDSASDAIDICSQVETHNIANETVERDKVNLSSLLLVLIQLLLFYFLPVSLDPIISTFDHASHQNN